MLLHIQAAAILTDFSSRSDTTLSSINAGLAVFVPWDWASFTLVMGASGYNVKTFLAFYLMDPCLAMEIPLTPASLSS